MKLKHYLRKSVTLPPHVVAKKVFVKAHKALTKNTERKKDSSNATYSELPTPDPGISFNYLKKISADQFKQLSHQLLTLSDHFLNHRFNFFGSGWVSVTYGMSCKGRENHRYQASSSPTPDPTGNWLNKIVTPGNLNYAHHVWSQIKGDYVPIDWHLDFISGYRWNSKAWFRDITIGDHQGVDIKVPWELSRMQHLAQLAFAFTLAKEQTPHFKTSDTYYREFKNQILDFIACNPPRFGPNWVCPMDVAIRAANWLVAYDLFKANGAPLDPTFETIFSNALYDHGLHVMNHLEWDPDLRGNHYLSDIVGLLFIGAYLPSCAEINAWLAFALQEFVKEVELQFYPDGSNFEGSTTYHRLSGEMALYGTALILGLPPEKRKAIANYDHRQLKRIPFRKKGPVKWYNHKEIEQATPLPLSHFKILEKAAEFSAIITKGNHHVPQIGDNDNGRFFKFQPICAAATGPEKTSDRALEEDHLDQRCLVAAANGLIPREDFASKTIGFELESQIIQSLSKNTHITSYRCHGDDLLNIDELVGTYSFPDYGLYLFLSRHLYFMIRCGAIGQKGNAGHSHNDQLSFELAVDGEDFIVDPGTYVYTPIPEMRNLFRSTKMHNTLVPENQEQNSWLPGSLGLFAMKSQMTPKVHQFEKSRFSGEHDAYGSPHRRTIDFSAKKLYGIDEYTGQCQKTIYFHIDTEVELELLKDFNGVILGKGPIKVLLKGGPGKWTLEDSFYSPCYGVIKNARAIKLTTSQDKIEWEIQVI